jgi:hypothetical protein
MTRLWNYGALAGAILWFVLILAWPGAAVQPFVFVHQLLAVGPLVIVPLALAHLIPDKSWGRGLFAAWAVGAVCAAVAVRLPTGIVAACVAGVWVPVTGALALFGARRIWGRFRAGTLGAQLPEACLDAALLYIPVGAIWLVADRGAYGLMGFPALIVVLTAAHFHFAGFAAPVVAGLTGRALPAPGWTWRVAAAAAIAGPPVVAIGISTSPWVEVVGSLVLAGGMALLAVVMIFVVGRALGGVARVLLTLGALAILATMLLACLYAVGQYIGFQAISIPLMIATHGVANVFGFSVLSLVAYALSVPQAPG